MASADGNRIAIFAPSTHLSVTLESTAGNDELHIHPAGQGFWVARMLTVLGEEPVLCTPVGGETGVALRALLGMLPVDGLLACSTANGSYVHDRRSGDREIVAAFPSVPLDRHVVDDLVSTTLACGLGSPVVVVCGSNLDGNVDPAVFERVCRDLGATGTAVIADLSGDELRAALAGGIGLLKLSDEEMVAGGWATSTSPEDVLDGLDRLRADGAQDVVVSCGPDGSVALLGDVRYRAVAPEMSVVEHRGAGDSMTAVFAHARRIGLDDEAMLRRAAAASALNVTRHGLASGHLGAIERLEPLVQIDVL